MRNLYLVLEKVNKYLSSHPLISSVTFGDIFDVDLKKQSIFPLAHVIVNDATFEGSSLNTVSFNLDILVMDIVDESKGDIRDEVDPFYGIDNTQDVLNSTLVVLNGLAQELVKGQLNTDLYQVQDASSITCSPFLDRFENKLAGWNMSVNIQTANTEISVC
jgi:hypothetical protein